MEPEGSSPHLQVPATYPYQFSQLLQFRDMNFFIVNWKPQSQQESDRRHTP